MANKTKSNPKQKVILVVKPRKTNPTKTRGSKYA